MPVPHSGVKLSIRRTKLPAYGISISYSWFSRNGLSFIALTLPLISSLRRLCFFISVLFVPLKFPLWYFVFSSQRFCRRAVLAAGSPRPPTLAMYLPIHCTPKIQVCRHSLRRWPTLSIEHCSHFKFASFAETQALHARSENWNLRVCCRLNHRCVRQK
jgi:hypothetical protein